MAAYRIPLNKSTLEKIEIEAAKDVLDSGFMTMGRRVEEFERAFAAYSGAKHALMVNSGSSANLLAAFVIADPLSPLRGRRRLLKPGSEVVVPALTWSTTIWPFVQAGAKPVFVDCDPKTLQSTPEAIEAAIGPDTVAICIVHVLGGAVDVAAVREIADRHGLWLIEDTCESLGVTWAGKQLGTCGDMGTYSFYFSHHITTIEGGMIVTDDDELAEVLRALRAHGWTRQMRDPSRFTSQHPEIDPRFYFITTGFNVRPTEINAAIGIEQLKKLDGFNRRRAEISAELRHELAAVENAGKLTIVDYDSRSTPAPFGFPVICLDHRTRNAFRAHLDASGIETRPIICGNMARQPAMAHIAHRICGTLSGADRVMDCGIYWATHPVMTSEDIAYIAGTVKGFFQ